MFSNSSEADFAPIATAIRRAKKTIDGLEAAAARGVVVRALIAHTNRGGEKSLRKLEMRLLEKGIAVSLVHEAASCSKPTAPGSRTPLASSGSS